MTGWRARRLLKWLLALALFTGAFFMGAGVGTVINYQKQRSLYADSTAGWQQGLTEGSGNGQARDRKNKELADYMGHVSIEPELYFPEEDGYGEARIAVDGEAVFGCTLTLIRDATGEELYRSGIIDPGHYIEKIRLNRSLKAGYYPCTAVWEFYTGEDECIGKAAGKVAVIIQK